jgi:allophanate hydrolase subunit 1
MTTDELKADLAAANERAEKAEAERDEAVAALQLLYDEQNGPPLERHAERWQAAMDAAEAVLVKAHDRDAAKRGE